MKRYYVKPIIEQCPWDCDVKYGVYDASPKDPEKIHCRLDDPNLILWTYNKLNAEKIAELLEVDDYIHETENK